MPDYRSASGSSAEDLFIELFSDAFGAEKAAYLYTQYHFSDIYQNSRFADFLLENGGRKVAIEIDDEASHNPRLVSQDKFYDDLLKQNSMIYLGWDVYRWVVRQMLHHTKTLGVIQVDESVWKKLTQEEKWEIEQICDKKPDEYYRRFS